MRVTDDFMQSAETEVLADQVGHDRRVGRDLRARDLLREMADAAHVCGDPGIQYDTTINRWNPVKNSGRINSSNPCSEYMFLDDTACNLASLNLMTFVDDDGEFEVEDFRRAVALTILGAGDPRRLRRLSDGADRARTATSIARSASATPTSARC